MLRRLGHQLILVFALFVGACTPPIANDDDHVSDLDSLLLQGIRETENLEFDIAHEKLTRLLERAREGNHARYQILANLNLGGLYVHFGGHEEALKYFFQALEVAEQREANELLNSIYNNIGVVYSHNGAHEKALNYFFEALEISRKRDEQRRIGMNLINMAISLEELDRDEESLAHFREAETIFRESGDIANLGAALNNAGNLFFKQGNFELAMEYYRESYELSQKSAQPWFRWEYSINLGKSHLKFGRLDSARFFLHEAIDGFLSTRNTGMLISAYTLLMEVEERENNSRKALEYANIALAYKDTLLEEKNARWVSELQMNFEFGKKEKELELLKESSRRRQLLWTGGVAGGITIVILLVITMRTANRNLRQKNVILEQEQAVTQLTIDKNKAQQEQLVREMEAREQMNRVEQEALLQKIAFRDRELVSKAMHLVNKNEVFSAVQHILDKGVKGQDSDPEKVIREALNVLKSAKNLDQDWEAFKKHFEEVHPGFFSSLHQRFPELTPGDLRMCAYLRLDLNAKEIAQIFNISPDSVRKRKQRLRDKLGLDAQMDLGDWLRA